MLFIEFINQIEALLVWKAHKLDLQTAGISQTVSGTCCLMSGVLAESYVLASNPGSSNG